MTHRYQKNVYIHTTLTQTHSLLLEGSEFLNIWTYLNLWLALHQMHEWKSALYIFINLEHSLAYSHYMRTHTHTGTLERGIMELMQWSAVDNEADVCLQGWHSRDTHTHTLAFLATFLPVPSSPPSSWSFNYPSPDTQRCDASVCLYGRMCVCWRSARVALE